MRKLLIYTVLLCIAILYNSACVFAQSSCPAKTSQTIQNLTVCGTFTYQGGTFPNFCSTPPILGQVPTWNGTSYCPMSPLDLLANVPVDPNTFGVKFDARTCYDVAVTNGSNLITIVPASDSGDCGTNPPQFTSADTGKLIKITPGQLSTNPGTVKFDGTVTYASATTLTLSVNYTGPTETCTGLTPDCANIEYGTNDGATFNTHWATLPVNSGEFDAMPQNATIMTAQPGLMTQGRNIRFAGQVEGLNISPNFSSLNNSNQPGTMIVPVFAPLPSLTITGATEAGSVATFTTSTSVTNILWSSIGQEINISGMTPSGYNGQWRVLLTPTPTSFSVQLNVSSLGAGGSGTAQAGQPSVINAQNSFYGLDFGFFMIDGDDNPADRPQSLINVMRAAYTPFPMSNPDLFGSTYPSSSFKFHDIYGGNLNNFEPIDYGLLGSRYAKIGLDTANSQGGSNDKGQIDNVRFTEVGTGFRITGSADEWSLNQIHCAECGITGESTVASATSFSHPESLNSGLNWYDHDTGDISATYCGAETDVTPPTAANWAPLESVPTKFIVEDDSLYPTTMEWYQVSTAGVTGTSKPNFHANCPNLGNTCTDGTGATQVTWTNISQNYHYFLMYAGVGSRFDSDHCGDGGNWESANNILNPSFNILIGTCSSDIAIIADNFDFVPFGVTNSNAQQWWNLSACGTGSKYFRSNGNRGLYASQFNLSRTTTTPGQITNVSLCRYPESISASGNAGLGECWQNILTGSDSNGVDAQRWDSMAKINDQGGSFALPQIGDPVTAPGSLSCATSGSTAYGVVYSGMITGPNGTLHTKVSPESCVANCASTVSSSNTIFGQLPWVPLGFPDHYNEYRTPASSSASFNLTVTAEPQSIIPAPTGSSVTFFGAVQGYTSATAPITAGTLVITDSHSLVITDNGAGGCTGTGVTNCTINYAAGQYSFTYAPASGTTWTAAYTAPCGSAGKIGGELFATSITTNAIAGSSSPNSFLDVTPDGSLGGSPSTTNTTGYMMASSINSTTDPVNNGDSIINQHPPGQLTRAALPTYQGIILGTSPPNNPAPVLYLQFKEASGTATDYSGNSNTATNHGSITYSQPGPIVNDPATGVLLDGSTAYYTVATASSLNVGDNVAVSCWIKPVNAASFTNNPTIMEQTATNGFYFLFGTTGRPYLQSNSMQTIATSSKSVPLDSNWHYVAFSKNGNTVYIMVDQDQVGTIVNDCVLNPSHCTLSPSSYGLVIGGSGSGGFDFNGDIAQCAVSQSKTVVQMQAEARFGPQLKNGAFQWDSTNNCWAVSYNDSWLCGQSPVFGPNLYYSSAGTPIPTCGTGWDGQFACVTDAAACTSGTSYSGGGGSTKCLVQCPLTGGGTWKETGTNCF